MMAYTNGDVKMTLYTYRINDGKLVSKTKVKDFRTKNKAENIGVICYLNVFISFYPLTKSQLIKIFNQLKKVYPRYENLYL